MDTSRLPSRRSSYVPRFHPYPKVKLSAREAMLVANDETRQDVVAGVGAGSSPGNTECHELAIILDEAIHPNSKDFVPQLRQRRLSLSILAVDLALMVIKRRSRKST
ncbi:hypothetical protein BS17DRAFT_342147 [Gyrodon lividus]|nr:hypothetical protein BS17DRAFT_342147 [Gyrodon lividus]